VSHEGRHLFVLQLYSVQSPNFSGPKPDYSGATSCLLRLTFDHWVTHSTNLFFFKISRPKFCQSLTYMIAPAVSNWWHLCVTDTASLSAICLPLINFITKLCNQNLSPCKWCQCVQKTTFVYVFLTISRQLLPPDPHRGSAPRHLVATLQKFLRAPMPVCDLMVNKVVY